MAGGTGVETPFSISSQDALFKIKYGEMSERVFNTGTPLLTRFKRDTSFDGKTWNFPVPLGFSGGVGSGDGSALPTANVAPLVEASVARKRNYAAIVLDRQAIKAANSNEGAFVRATKFQVKEAVDSFTRNLSRQLFAVENGMLGQGDNSTTVSGTGAAGDPWVVVMAAASWNTANWEEGDFVNVGAETTQVEVKTVTPETRTLAFVGTSATLLAAAGSTATAAKFYMQRSKDNDIQSLYQLLTATTGTYYNIPIQRRWKAFQDTTTQPVSPEVYNKLAIGVEKQSGKAPNLFVTSYKQLQKTIDFLEDQKRYPIMGRAGADKGRVLFQGVEIMTSTGPAGLIADRFCPDGALLALNDEYLTLASAGPPSWVDEDGAVLSRIPGTDRLTALYAGYLQMYSPPSFHGIATGLT